MPTNIFEVFNYKNNNNATLLNSEGYCNDKNKYCKKNIPQFKMLFLTYVRYCGIKT